MYKTQASIFYGIYKPPSRVSGYLSKTLNYFEIDWVCILRGGVISHRHGRCDAMQRHVYDGGCNGKSRLAVALRCAMRCNVSTLLKLDEHKYANVDHVYTGCIYFGVIKSTLMRVINKMQCLNRYNVLTLITQFSDINVLLL